MKKKIQKGFSLVELMVVIAIIAILAAVAIPMYSNYTTRAKIGTALASVGGLKAQVAENLANSVNGDSNVTYVGEQKTGMAYGTGVNAAGDITLTFTSPVSGSVVLSPNNNGGSVTWNCISTSSAISSSGSAVNASSPALGGTATQAEIAQALLPSPCTGA
ncbi:pilin [Francisella salimarina]|uniref:Prepilin-type N-terminal cleavage/methylation domain-containing protein n=1 Tax=Francisella salimarina TaxID=2599927 RepID=A0AAJ4NPW2_9GAMM|nr:prepilin-type N-terminal cleavage/methylation domain-containing protein [Francisella salimarina]QWU99680.1 prepilin-type N-terminal cleavage/methylation domain-containing protein [Francisella salimarina]